MIRIVVLALVAANLLYLGWAHWAREEAPRLVAPASGSGSASLPAAPEATCVSLGPLRDETAAMEVEQLLRDMRLAPLARRVSQQTSEGWWVHVTSIDAQAQARTLRTIEEAGITDAFSLPDDPGFRVSVGLFRDEASASSRAEAVRALGLDATVTERMQEQTSIWFDLPGTTRAALELARLAAEGVDVQALKVEDCPAGSAPQL